MCDYTMYFSGIYFMCVGLGLMTSMTINLYLYEPTVYKSAV